jgi:two-component system chemotaxis sensor kinase CheA
MSNDTNNPGDSSGSPLSDEMAQYLQVYIDESNEELEALIEAILQLEIDPLNADALNRSFRMLHSLKGSSGMLGFDIAGNFAHELEDRFERYRSKLAVLDRDTTTLVLKCVDYFRGFLDRLKAGDHSQGDPSPLLDQLRELEHRAIVPAAAIPNRTGPVRVVSELPAMTISSGLKVLVTFRPGLQLADLKARLIVSKLSAIGEILSCEPPIDDGHSFDELPLFSLTLVTDRAIEEVRKIASVDGVTSVEIQGSELFAGRRENSPTTVVPSLLDSVPAEAPIQVSELPPREPMEQSFPAASISTEADSVEAKGHVSDTLRVDIGRLDRLMNLTGELVVANARFAQIAAEMSPIFRRNEVVKKSKELTERLRGRFERIRSALTDASHHQIREDVFHGIDEELDGLDQQSEIWEEGHRHFSDMTEAVDQLTRVSKNLQRGVLNTRMVPIGPLFNRFKRVIRDLSVERRKKVHLTIQGEKTELDKRMIDALGDPLLHLVRNSIDHGLESADERAAAGKPDVGTISLEAAHRGNSVWITVRDDGGGVDAGKILARILSRGLATETQAREMTEQQIISHIWHPGFSTAESITEISGRGVGMDIVRNAISELSGTIDLVSTPGVGTTFTIRLPLTLAIIHSLIIRFRDDFFSIPIDDVREIVSVPRECIYTVHRQLVIDVRNELIPLVSMGRLFVWNDRFEEVAETEAAAQNAGTSVNVVVLHSRGRTLGLKVDSLVGRADLVIKSLSDNFQPVRGLSGASILGDGTVCLMLDSASLIELASETVPSRSLS